MKIKSVIVSGAAGFAGCNLVEHLAANGIYVYALVRAGSRHNERLKKLETSKVELVEADFDDYASLPEKIKGTPEVFFHLAWGSKGRNDIPTEYANVGRTLEAVKAAKKIGCKRFVATGSQAEYGVKSGMITEDLIADPFSAYGAAKTAACYLSRHLAADLGIEWIWGRIFSLYGKYEPHGRLLPDIIEKLKKGEVPSISKAEQYWDYLDAADGAAAILALARSGRNGEIYNIANGDYHPLKFFMEKLRDRYAPDAEIIYGEAPNPFVSLKPSVEKIYHDTGWRAKVEFMDSIKEIYG